MNPTDFFCNSCGWTGNPAKKRRVESVFRKKKAGKCPACGYDTVPITSRIKLAQPGLVIQPPDPVISKILEKVAAALQKP